MKKAFIFFLLLALWGVGCGPIITYPKPPLPFDGAGGQAVEYQSTHAMNLVLDKVSKEAQIEQEPEKCLGLPLKGAAWEWWDDGFVYNNNPMQWRCLVSMMHTVPTSKVCKLMAQVPEADADFYKKKGEIFDDCYLYAAQSENNKMLCEELGNTDAKAHCLALTIKEAAPCLAISRLREDQTKKSIVASTKNAVAYIEDSSYSAATCIQAVVYRTHDYQTCEIIDGVRFGENWTRSRNNCLEIAGYQLKKAGQSNKICDAFVEDHSNEGALSWGARINCQNYGATIDPNDFWKREKWNVLHISPGIQD